MTLPEAGVIAKEEKYDAPPFAEISNPAGAVKTTFAEVKPSPINVNV